MTHLTHTTLLVRSVDRVAEFFAKKNFYINPPDVFESEGTREIYIGNNDEHSSTLLLVQPIGPGPYQKALDKRGAGLHHIGLDVDHLVPYCTELGRAGWLLHTHSLVSVPKLKTAFLTRPGVPLILEVREQRVVNPAPSLLTEIGFPGMAKHQSMIDVLGLANARITPSTELVFETFKGRFSLKDILACDQNGS